MARIRAERWVSLLVVALLAVVLALPACGGGGGGREETPQATTATGETPGAEKVPGVTDTEILLGSHLPLSGMAAAYGVGVKAGMEAYFSLRQ